MAKQYTLEDSPVYLRDLDEDDVTERYVSWFADAEFTGFLEARNLTRDQIIDHLRHGQKTGDYFMYAIVLKETGQHVGNTKLGPFDRDNGVSDLSTVIGEKSCWGKGIGRAAIQIANTLAFNLHGVRKLSAKIHGDNVGSIKAYTGAGWEIEGRFADHVIVDGKLQDVVLVSCFNDGQK